MMTTDVLDPNFSFDNWRHEFQELSPPHTPLEDRKPTTRLYHHALSESPTSTRSSLLNFRPSSDGVRVWPIRPVFPLMRLPSEIRLQIYAHVLLEPRSSNLFKWWGTISSRPNYEFPKVHYHCPALLLVSRQISNEAAPVYYENHPFHFTDMKALSRFLKERPANQLAFIRRVTVCPHPMLALKTYDYEDDVRTWEMLLERCVQLKELWFEVMLSSRVFRNGVAGMEVLSQLRGMRDGGMQQTLRENSVEVEFEWMKTLRELWRMPKRDEGQSGS